MDPATGSAAVHIAAALLKEAEKQGLFDRLITVFKTKPRIFLLGSTGTGKTEFLESLVKDVPAAIRREDRTLYTEAKNLMVNDKPYRFIDTTGDALRSDDRRQAMREAMAARGGIAGVINVVSYGYHEYDVSRDKIFTSGSTVDPAYLDLHRNEEIRQLDEWTPVLGDPLTANWLITVVTKADLWWEQRVKVMAHYTTGPYYKALGSAKSLGQRVLPYSSVFHKFYGEAAMDGTFDQDDRKLARDRLLGALVKALLKKQGV